MSVQTIPTSNKRQNLNIDVLPSTNDLPMEQTWNAHSNVLSPNDGSNQPNEMNIEVYDNTDQLQDRMQDKYEDQVQAFQIARQYQHNKSSSKLESPQDLQSIQPFIDGRGNKFRDGPYDDDSSIPLFTTQKIQNNINAFDNSTHNNFSQRNEGCDASK